MKIKSIVIVIIFLILIVILAIVELNLYKNNKSNESAAILLYKEIIDKIFALNKDIISKTENVYINVDELIDPLNGNLLSNNSKIVINNYCKDYCKINNSKDTNYSINIHQFSKFSNKVSFNIMVKYGSSSQMISYTAEYINNSWKLQDISRIVQ